MSDEARTEPGVILVKVKASKGDHRSQRAGSFLPGAPLVVLPGAAVSGTLPGCSGTQVGPGLFLPRPAMPVPESKARPCALPCPFDWILPAPLAVW